jgi:heptaprenyl diphosphate synthase
MSSLDLSSVLGMPDLPLYLKQVDEALDTVIHSDNPLIRRPVVRLVRAPSKRLRPALIIAVATSQGISIDEAVISSCVAVELVHIASLVHDDVIDDADTRRGIPTINGNEGVGTAILIGDYLLAKAGMQAAAVNTRVAYIVGETIVALCDGQVRELADQYNIRRSQASMLKAIHGKTASLMSAACQIGGLSAGLDAAHIDVLARYGEDFGMAFQLIDDVLDYLSTAELSGKPVGHDIIEGVYTMPLLLALRGPHGSAVKAMLKQKVPTSVLVDALTQDGCIELTILEAQRYATSAMKALTGLMPSGNIASLLALPDAYLHWALEQLVAEEHRPTIATMLSGLPEKA